MSTGAPAGNRSASRWAALWALVTTSSGAAVKPIARRCWATSPGPREALLVTYSVRAVTAASVSTAPGVGSWPRNTVPSRSRSKQSCSCARVVTSAELRDPLFGVGHALDIGGCGVDEPLQGFFALCRVRAAFRRRRRTGGRRSARFASDRVAASTGSQGPDPAVPGRTGRRPRRYAVRRRRRRSAGRPRNCGPIRSPARDGRDRVHSRRSAATAGTCCPAGGRLAVRRVACAQSPQW